MTPGEVGVWLPWWCHALVLPAPGNWGLFLKSLISAILPYEILPFNFDLKFCWNWSFFHYEKILRFKKSPQLLGAGRTRAWHHHGSHTPTSPGVILLSKMACQPKHFGRQCNLMNIEYLQVGIRVVFVHSVCFLIHLNRASVNFKAIVFAEKSQEVPLLRACIYVWFYKKISIIPFSIAH